MQGYNVTSNIIIYIHFEQRPETEDLSVKQFPS